MGGKSFLVALRDISAQNIKARTSSGDSVLPVRASIPGQQSESTKLGHWAKGLDLDVREVAQISDILKTIFFQFTRLKWKAGVPTSLCSKQIQKLVSTYPN